MTQMESIVDVATIVRQFLQNEAQTLRISKGKMLKDDEIDRIIPKYMQVG